MPCETMTLFVSNDDSAKLRVQSNMAVEVCSIWYFARALDKFQSSSLEIHLSNAHQCSGPKSKRRVHK
jgi:hypothetical protein